MLRKLFSFLFRLVQGIIVFLFIGCLLLWAFSETPQGQQWVLSTLTQSLSRQAHLAVEWQGARYSFPFQLQAEQVTLEPHGHPPLHLSQVTLALHWRPLIVSAPPILLSFKCTYREEPLSGHIAIDTPLSESQRLSGKGRVQTTEYALETPFVIHDQIVYFSALDLTGPAIKGQGELQYELSSRVWIGHLMLQLESLKALSPLFEEPPRGQGKCLLTFSKKINRTGQHIALQSEWRHLSWQNAFVEHLQLDTQIDPLDQWWPLQMTVHTTTPLSIAGKAIGSWHADPSHLQFYLSHLTGEIDRTPLHLHRPFFLSSTSQTLQITPLSLQYGQAIIEGEFIQREGQFSTQWKIDALPLSFLSPFLPPSSSQVSLQGTLSGEGEVTGGVASPTGRLSIAVSHLAFSPTLPPLTAHAELVLSETGIEVRGQIKPTETSVVQVTGHLPWKLTPTSPFFELDEMLTSSLTAHINGPIDLYVTQFIPKLEPFTGWINGQVTCQGLPHQPQWHGFLDLIDGMYESHAMGMRYHHINGHIEGNESRLLLTTLSATDERGGHLSGSGKLFLDSPDLFFECPLYASRVAIVDSDSLSVLASGPLLFSGNRHASTLSGSLTAEEATFRLEEPLPRQIKTLEIEYVSSAHPTTPATKEIPHSFELDLSLKASRIAIRDDALSSIWKGSVALKGDPAHLQLYGDLRILQGEYTIKGKTFQLSQGQIHFAGSPEKKTTLYVVAEKEIDRIRAEIILKGPAQSPVITFRSTPPLSQREVLSYILFNRGISDITADQGIELSQSFISLRSTSQTSTSDDFLSRLRNRIGLDRLDVISGNSEGHDIGIQVGKKVSEKVSLSVSQSVTSLTPLIAVEAKLRKNLKAQVEGGVLQDSPVRMSIKWKKDY